MENRHTVPTVVPGVVRSRESREAKENLKSALSPRAGSLGPRNGNGNSDNEKRLSPRTSSPSRGEKERRMVCICTQGSTPSNPPSSPKSVNTDLASHVGRPSTGSQMTSAPSDAIRNSDRTGVDRIWSQGTLTSLSRATLVLKRVRASSRTSRAGESMGLGSIGFIGRRKQRQWAWLGDMEIDDMVLGLGAAGVFHGSPPLAIGFLVNAAHCAEKAKTEEKDPEKDKTASASGSAGVAQSGGSTP